MKAEAIALATNYEITERLFHGVRTQILRGVRLRDQMMVILKVLASQTAMPADLARFRREFQLTGILHSHAVPSVYDLSYSDDRWMIIFEDIGAASLEHQLPNLRKSPQDMVRLAIKICEALDAIHTMGIVHKDINPSNIIYCPTTDRLQIIDFGIATQLSKEEPFFTSPNLLEGTIAYISPEQTGRMNRPIDYRADFYSLGVTMYEMFSGHQPFNSKDALEIIHHHIAQSPPPFARSHGLPIILEQIVCKLMAKDPQQRYQSALGIAHDLQWCLEYWHKEDNLTLGRGDTKSRFTLPSQLYGRKPQIAALLAAFTRAAQGTTAIVIVQGTSGIGKSALVGEVQKPIAEHHGLFISGKFDQYKQSTPYEPFIHALRELIKTLMSLRTQELALWQQRIRLALKNNGAVLAEVLPELIMLTGPWPAVPQLSPPKALSRFRMVIEDFVRAVATVQHPLVLFLDDLQWADLSSLKLIEILGMTQDQQTLLLILGFRDNEVGPNHPLRATLLTLQNRGIMPQTLIVGPLALPDTTQFVADCLCTTPSEVTELADLCAHKTAGNPFFLRQMLNMLYERAQIFFVPTTQSFSFNIEEIRKIPIADNVVDVLLVELQRLPSLTRKIIAHAACIGGEFDLGILASLLQLTRQQVASHLTGALIAGFVIPLDPEYRQAEDEAAVVNVRYRFAHDRIQQATLQLLGEDELIVANLQIGRIYEQRYVTTGTHLIDAVFRLYAGRSVLSTDEQTALAALALKAGVQAAAASAHDSAFNLFVLGIELLGERPWQRDQELCQALHSQLLKIAHHAGQIGKMADYFETFVRNTPDALQQVDAQVAMMESLAQRAQSADALNVASAYLAKLGVDIPRRGSMTYAIIRLPYFLFAVRPRRLVRLEQTPETSDQKQLVIYRVLAAMAHFATFYDPILAAIVAVKQVTLMLDHGVSEDGLIGLANLACVFNAKIVSRHAWGRVAIQTALKILLARNYRWGYARASYLAHGLIDAWTQPLRRDGVKLEDVAQACFDRGNYEDGCQALAGCIFTREYTWEQIGPILENAPSWLKTARRFNLVNVETYMRVNIQALANLANQVAKPWILDGEFAKEEELIATLDATANSLGRFSFWRSKGINACICGQYAEAAAAFKQGAPYSKTCEAFAPIAHYTQFFETYARLQLLPSRTITTSLALLAMLRKLRYIRIMGRANPIAFGWAPLLMRAEVYRLIGLRTLAFESFRLARMKARDSEYLLPQAFVNECLGHCYLAEGDASSGHQSLREAVRIYRAWGALGKASQMEESFPLLCEATAPNHTVSRTRSAQSTTSQVGDNFDLESILKASQAVSSELQFDTLIKRLMKITLENAGACQAYLLLREGDELYCRVRGALEPDLTITATNIRVEELAPQMCTALALYVARTGGTVVLADAHSEGAYPTDPYMASGQRRSIACLPIENQGECIGVLYVENELTIGVFTSERMRTLGVLAAQGAISLKNVQYVESLKDKVRLENDLLAAQAVQEALLPDSDVTVPGIEIVSYYGAAEQTGGDWFGSHYAADKEVLYLQIGDVTGHGIPSALVTAAVCGAILGAYHLLANTPHSSLEEDIWQLALAANNAVAATGRRVGRLMTMAFIGINVHTGEGVYFNAAHLPILLRQKDKVSVLLRGGYMLGEFEADAAPDLIKFMLEPSDILLAATDGLFENGLGLAKPFNIKAMRKILQNSGTLEELQQHINEVYLQSLAGTKPADDCTYVILRRPPR